MYVSCAQCGPGAELCDLCFDDFCCLSVMAWHISYWTSACMFSMVLCVISVCILLGELVHGLVKVPMYAIYSLMIMLSVSVSLCFSFSLSLSLSLSFFLSLFLSLLSLSAWRRVTNLSAATILI